ncbi:hypothetical protein [Hyphococcus luteus]|uniref:hypothetical protein n=1 Tax=Hyphococcus luteus TaxID=2058213 RepID=UPI0013FDF62B|nr:hypothetical protein [Marinicaulis flavus]
MKRRPAIASPLRLTGRSGQHVEDLLAHLRIGDGDKNAHHVIVPGSPENQLSEAPADWAFSGIVIYPVCFSY